MCILAENSDSVILLQASIWFELWIKEQVYIIVGSFYVMVFESYAGLKINLFYVLMRTLPFIIVSLSGIWETWGMWVCSLFLSLKNVFSFGRGGGIARPLLTSFYTYSWLWQRISNTLPAYLFNTLNKYSVIQISKQSYDQFISNSNSYVKFVIACNKNVWLFFHYRCMIHVFLLTCILAVKRLSNFYSVFFSSSNSGFNVS